jgi:hypothetical protein
MLPIRHMSPTGTTMALPETYVVFVPIMTMAGALMVVLRRGLTVGL